jgi:hypothetical protein
MGPAMSQRSIYAVWAEALFVSVLQPSQSPGVGQVRQAVEAAVHRSGWHPRARAA